MFKRLTLALLMVATLGFGALGVASSSEAQIFRSRAYWGYPGYQTYYYAPPGYSYNYYYPRTYSTWYGAPYSGYYYPSYSGVPYYTARPQIQYYYYR